jgi:hypothetical protein
VEYIIQENGTEAILTMFSYLIVQSKESLCSSKNSTVIWVSPGELSDEKQLGQAVIERQNQAHPDVEVGENNTKLIYYYMTPIISFAKLELNSKAQSLFLFRTLFQLSKRRFLLL